MAAAVLLVCIQSCRPAAPGELVLYAAASTTDLLQTAAVAFTAETEVPVNFEFGSSGSLARKIEAGAPADVFISANPEWIAYLADKSRLTPGSPEIFARNRLVCVIPAGSAGGPASPADLRHLERLSIGDPDHVPAGNYARQVLQRYGLWDDLVSRGRLVLAPDVRAALSRVEQGETPAGIVYGTDAAQSRRVTVAFAFPEDSHAPVTYHAAIVRRSAGRDDARRFLRFLETDAFRDILAEKGFRAP